jgi:hypothetical protein
MAAPLLLEKFPADSSLRFIIAVYLQPLIPAGYQSLCIAVL